MKQRRTVSLHDALVVDLERIAKDWKVGESEALRRILALGFYFAKALKTKSVFKETKFDGTTVELQFVGLGFVK